jgi:hypothetical protein
MTPRTPCLINSRRVGRHHHEIGGQPLVLSRLHVEHVPESALHRIVFLPLVANRPFHRDHITVFQDPSYRDLGSSNEAFIFDLRIERRSALS